ncbi:11491_t:CDS:2, partial [Dentiscutata heterogama]
SYNTYLHALPLLPDLNQMKKQFKIAISDSLNKYWLDFCEVRLKEYKDLQHLNIVSNNQPKQQTSIPIINEIMQNLFFKSIFEVQDQEDMSLDEVVEYLKISLNNYNANS